MTNTRILWVSLLAVSLSACSKQPQETEQQGTENILEQAANAPPQAPAEKNEVAPSPVSKASSPAQVGPSTRSKQAVRTSAPQNTAVRTPESARSTAVAPPSQGVPIQTATGEGAPLVAYKAESAAEPSSPPAPRFASIASGTRLPISLVDALDSTINKTGDTFQATLDEGLVVDGITVVPRGSTVMGRLTQVQDAGRVKGLAQMSLTLTDLQLDGQTLAIHTNTLDLEAENTKKGDAAKIGAGAGIGAIIGAIAGGGKGAAIGAAAGGGAGTATVLATKGKALKFPPEHRFTFTLGEDLRVQLK